MATNPNNGSNITTPVSNESGNEVVTSLTNAASTTGNIIVSRGGVADSVITGVVGQAAAPVIDVAQKGAQVVDLIRNPTLGGALALLGRGFPPYRNELDQFASYNSIFTLGCLTNLELNFPPSYRTMGPLIKIIKSGGTGGNKIPTIYETDGAREYFIENVNIQSTMAPNPGTRHSNAITITFDVIEPYSMGQFLHNLRVAATVAGHSNYVDAPFLLSVAFVGYDDDGNVKSPLFSQRHFPIRIIGAQMKVSNSGAVYHVEAAAYNDMASSDTTQTTVQDISATGETVGEILTSVTQSINENLLRNQGSSQIPTADQYIISFPQSGILDGLGGTIAASVSSATSRAGKTLRDLYIQLTGDRAGEVPQGAVQQAQSEYRGVSTTRSAIGEMLRSQAENPALWNEIGKSNIVNSAEESGNFPFQKASFVETEEGSGIFRRGSLTYNTNTRQYQFAAGARIESIIEEVIILSDYGRQFVTRPADAFGRIPWFRIETQVYNASSFFNAVSQGADPKVYVYRVVPYEVDVSNTAGPRSSVLQTFTRQAKAIKSYNYIYTGQNTDIIDFDLNFDFTFFTGVQGDRGQRNQDSILGSVADWIRGDQEPATSSGTYDDAILRQARINPPAGGPPIGTNEAARIRQQPGTNRTVNGGGGREGALVSVARALNDMVINTSNDMIQIELTIHGDPYYLADAGMGNYVGIANPVNSAITVEGSMNPIDGEVHIVLNFRTPIDYSEEDGFVKYPLGGFLPIAMFSGVYAVILVNSEFKQGKFTQKLMLARKRNQDLTLESIASAIISDIKGARAIGEGTNQNRTEPVPEAGQDR